MIVSVKELVKTFEQRGMFPWSDVQYVKAVQGVNLHVAPGEIIALVGIWLRKRRCLAHSAWKKDFRRDLVGRYRWDGLWKKASSIAFKVSICPTTRCLHSILTKQHRTHHGDIWFLRGPRKEGESKRECY